MKEPPLREGPSRETSGRRLEKYVERILCPIDFVHTLMLRVNVGLPSVRRHRHADNGDSASPLSGQTRRTCTNSKRTKAVRNDGQA